MTDYIVFNSTRIDTAEIQGSIAFNSKQFYNSIRDLSESAVSIAGRLFGRLSSVYPKSAYVCANGICWMLPDIALPLSQSLSPKLHSSIKLAVDNYLLLNENVDVEEASNKEAGLLTFNNPQFGTVRVVEVDKKPMFVARDVATALGYRKPENAISQHVDKEDTLKQGIQDKKGAVQNTTLINESGVYALIFGSQLASAKKFKRWVTTVVLPSIRQTGSFSVQNQLPDFDDPIAAATAWIEAKRLSKLNLHKSIMLTNIIEEQKPAIALVETIKKVDNCMSIADLANAYKTCGMNIGQNVLFAWMRDNGYLCHIRSRRNMPTSKATDMGLLKIKTVRYTNDETGEEMISSSSQVTPQGQIFFLNKFLSEKIFA